MASGTVHRAITPLMFEPTLLLVIVALLTVIVLLRGPARH